MTKQKILSICNFIKAKYKTADPFKICKMLNITVLFVELSDIRGFCHHALNSQFIYIKKTLPETEQRFICSHELAHILLHYNDNAIFMASSTYIMPTKLENEANLFAEYLCNLC